MNVHFSIPFFSTRYTATSWPCHLPRFLLAERFQPRFVRRCPVTRRLTQLLQPLDWEQLPTTLAHGRTGGRSIPLAAYCAAYLVKLDENLPSFGHLRRFLRDHPALIWSLGFPLVSDRNAPCGYAADASLPSQRHLSRHLSRLPNGVLQLLLDGQVAWLRDRFGDEFGDVVSFDTKHIIAWVKENNPKTFIKEGRHDKTRQPVGDPDCKLGCKRRRNQTTPAKEGEPVGSKVGVGEFYWGYASGVAATKVPGAGEFVLAECTRTFDHSDVSYFFPLMDQVEQRLGRRPRFGTGDAAFDAWYVYDYFHSDDHDGFAAIPKHDARELTFSGDGLPLCDAGRPMTLNGTYVNRTSFVQHRRGRFGCPLQNDAAPAETCPTDHPRWSNGGCKRTLPLAPGARIRHELDRESVAYRTIYSQRTAVERIFSQAVALGIERPKLRNHYAIANINTLTYVLTNLRTMRRVATAGVGHID